jgi:hypothetical protein
MAKERKKFENMKNYDSDSNSNFTSDRDSNSNNNFTSDREKASMYYNLLVAGKLLFNITVFVVFIIII